MSKEKDSCDLVPFDYVGEDFCITAYGEIVFAVKIEMREVYTLSDNEGVDGSASDKELFYHNYKNALGILPEGVTVQKIVKVHTLPYSPEGSGGNLTKRWNEQYYSMRDVVFENTYLVVYFPFRNYKKGSKLDTLRKRMSRFSGSEKLPEIQGQYNSFVSSLKGSVEGLTQLEGYKLVELYCESWNLEYNSSFGQNHQLQPINITSGEPMRIGSEYVTVLNTSMLPSNFDGFTRMNRKIVESKDIDNNTTYVNEVSLPTSFLFPIGCGLPVNHILVETLKILDKESVEKKMLAEKQKLNFLIGMRIQSAIKKAEKIEEFIYVKNEYDHKYAEWGVTVVLHSPDKDRLSKLTNVVRDKCKKELGLSMAVQNGKIFETFYASLPGCSATNKELRLGYLNVFCYLTHIETFKKGNSEGLLLVDLFGKPFVFDFWDQKNRFLQARNGVVFAPTGQGKSFVVNSILDQSFDMGDVIFIIDIGGSYERLVMLSGGEYYDSKDITNMSFNPFLECYQRNGKCFPELDDDGKKETMYLEYVTALLMACYSSQSATEGSVDIVSRSILAYFEAYNQNKVDGKLCFDSYYDFVKEDFFVEHKEYHKFLRVDEYLLVLEKYYGENSYGFLMNSDRIMDINNRMVCFDLIGVKDNPLISAPVMLMVMHQSNRMQSKFFGNRFRFFIDEALDFLQGTSMAKYVGASYRKIRKTGGQIFIITQSISFIENLEPMLRSSILVNTEIKIMLDHSRAQPDIDLLVKHLSLSQSEEALLRNQTANEESPYRIGFMKFGAMKGFLFRIEVSDKTRSLYQTNAEDIIKIKKLLQERGSVESAVETFIESNN